MNLLVAGARDFDAGKTTFSVGLLERTGGVGYKPQAGNDYWYSHDDVLTAAKAGTLFGKDARRLAAASTGVEAPTSINPIHRLWRPVPGGVGAVLGQDRREFLVDRVGDTYVVNGRTSIPESIRSAFPLTEALSVDSLEAFNDVMATHHRRAQTNLAAEIDARPLTVVESYADIARPLQSLEHDGVAVVEPQRVRIYDGRRYDKACSVASGSPTAGGGRLEERVDAVTELLDPVTVCQIPPLSSRSRRDPAAVAEAYAHVYDELLAAAK